MTRAEALRYALLTGLVLLLAASVMLGLDVPGAWAIYGVGVGLVVLFALGIIIEILTLMRRPPASREAEEFSLE